MGAVLEFESFAICGIDGTNGPDTKSTPESVSSARKLAGTSRGMHTGKESRHRYEGDNKSFSGGFETMINVISILNCR